MKNLAPYLTGKTESVRLFNYWLCLLKLPPHCDQKNMCDQEGGGLADLK